MKTDNKIKIFCDLDNTVLMTIKAICEMYNEDYCSKEGFIPADWKKVNKYNFTDQCTLLSIENLDNYFCEERFFNKVKLMPGASYGLIALYDEYELIFLSLGQIDNLNKKAYFVRSYFSGANIKFIGLDIEKYNDKSCIDMSNAIIIDDHSGILNNCNAMRKICFGPVYEWNKDWTGERAETWTDVLKLLEIK